MRCQLRGKVHLLIIRCVIFGVRLSSLIPGRRRSPFIYPLIVVMCFTVTEFVWVAGRRRETSTIISMIPLI